MKRVLSASEVQANFSEPSLAQWEGETLFFLQAVLDTDV